MPLGPYTDFAECVAAQMKKKGIDKLSAEKICGYIEKQTKEAHDKENK